MVKSSDSIRYTNVVSRKYRFYYKDHNEVMTDFLNDVVKQKATIKGPLFYSINNVPMDEIVHAEFFMPIEEDRIDLLENMSFQSYYSIEDMITYCLYANFEKNTEVAYKILFDYMEHRKLRQISPIFHIISGDRSLPYVFIKMGVLSLLEA